jgi:hypothetical protein
VCALFVPPVNGNDIMLEEYYVCVVCGFGLCNGVVGGRCADESMTTVSMVQWADNLCLLHVYGGITKEAQTKSR